MDEKKTRRADLEKDRTIYFLFGLAVVLASLFVVFEWQSEEVLSPNWSGFTTVFIEEDLLIAEPFRQEKTPEVEVETPAPAVVYEDFQVVNEVEEKESVIPEEISPKENQPEETNIVEQTIIETPNEPVVPDKETDPQFPGGRNALARFIYNNLIYPNSAIKRKQEGRVWCSFIVNQDGSLTDIKVEEGVSAELDKEAIVVLHLMPPWIPGTLNNEPVRTKVYLPIFFKL